MAIDRMKKLTVVCPVHAAHRLARALYGLRAVEVVDAVETYGETAGALERHPVSTETCDIEINKINLSLALIDEIAPEKKGFFEGLTPLPLLVDPKELESVLHGSRLDAVHDEARALDEARKRVDRRTAEIRAQIDALAPFADVPFSIADLRRPQRMRILFGNIPKRQADGLAAAPGLSEKIAYEIVPAAKALRAGDTAAAAPAAKADTARVLVAFLPEDEDAVRRLLAAELFEEVPLPNVPGTVRDRMRELEGDLAACAEELDGVRERVVALAKHRRALLVLRGHWDGARRQAAAHSETLQGRWVHVLTGYCRARDLDRIEKTLQKEVPEAAVMSEDPAVDDDVPISITLPKLVRPVYMLISLFGLPPYSAFDASPFIILPFYLFFGICFGDVGYGLMLIALGWYLSRKTKAYEGVHNFSQLLYFAGFSTVIFGALLGSWFGDLYDPKYLGADNLMFKAKTATMVLDPLQDPVTMLLVALGIGVCNQLYGVVLKMHGALKSGDWQAAAFDGLLWLVTLPGLVLLIGNFLGGLGTASALAGKALFLVGAAGLLLTQGRGETGVVLKGVNGLVSIYGILGSYGCAAFIGDTLSYCRLLALGLTTSIVAMCVNMIGGLVLGIPYVGVVLFVIVLVAGHSFNFAISLLGAFVHSMRLIFVELFGRFYSGGSREFRPLGFDSDTCQLVVRTE